VNSPPTSIAETPPAPVIEILLSAAPDDLVDVLAELVLDAPLFPDVVVPLPLFDEVMVVEPVVVVPVLVVFVMLVLPEI